MIKTLTAFIFAAIFIPGGPSNTIADDLGAALRESGWESIIGTWVDPETKGNTRKLTFRWVYENKVIEITNREGNQETTALMARHAKTGDVSYVAADNQGGSSIGRWTIDGEAAVLEMLYVSGSGDEGALQVRHTMEGKDTMMVTIVLPEPISFKLERVKQDK